jgi:preprotein translocase subunit SecE
MNAKTESTVNKSDVAKWLVTVVLFAVALVLNYYFSKIAMPVRIIGWIVIFAALLGLVAWTTQGRAAIEFLGEAKMELRKVVWPTSQETIQTTGLIIVMVVIFGLIMWGFDTLMLFLIGLLTG